MLRAARRDARRSRRRDRARRRAMRLARVNREDDGDTIYAIDASPKRVARSLRRAAVARRSRSCWWRKGCRADARVCPASGTDEAGATWRIIVDPIDGTRGLMYQKRSAWILTGVAPNRGPATSLQDIVLAVQTEIPLRQAAPRRISSWAIRGAGRHAQRYNRLTGSARRSGLQPSTATTIAHGYATVARFFPGARDELAAIDEEIVARRARRRPAGKAHCFEDQYASTGGQLYELMAGHDRFIADPAAAGSADTPCLSWPELRGGRGALLPSVRHLLRAHRRRERRDRDRSSGQPLDAPLNVEADVAWVGLRERADPAADRAAAAGGAAQARLDLIEDGTPPRDLSGAPATSRRSSSTLRAVEDARSSASRSQALRRSVRPGSRCRARARTARRDGRHRRLLRVARPAASDRRSDLRGRAATSIARARNHQHRPVARSRCRSTCWPPADGSACQHGLDLRSTWRRMLEAARIASAGTDTLGGVIVACSSSWCASDRLPFDGGATIVIDSRGARGKGRQLVGRARNGSDGGAVAAFDAALGRAISRCCARRPRTSSPARRAA